MLQQDESEQSDGLGMMIFPTCPEDLSGAFDKCWKRSAQADKKGSSMKGLYTSSKYPQSTIHELKFLGCFMGKEVERCTTYGVDVMTVRSISGCYVSSIVGPGPGITPKSLNLN